ncbi:MAG TPA: glycogen-binding domain-containing protein [Polyangia bacterium]|jgi:hypothetical protein
MSGTIHATPPSASGGVDVSLQGGYDSNLFLLVASSPDSPTYRRYSGWFIRVDPTGTAALAGDTLRIDLRADADIRQTFGSGSLFLEDVQLALVRPELGPIDLRIALTGGRFDATVDEGLRFSSAGLLLQAGWHLFERWRFGAFYRLTARWFGAPAQIGVDRDFAQDGQLRVGLGLAPGAEVAASAGYLHLRSASDGASTTPGIGTAVDRLWGGLDGLYGWAPRTTLSASGWTGAMRSDVAGTDLQVGGAAACSVRWLDNLEVLARYDFMLDRGGASSTTGGFQRQVVMVGLAWREATASRAAKPLPEGGRGEGSQTALGKVRFSLRAPGASSVTVVGSWNAWASGLPEQSLRRTPDRDLWEVSLDLPPGAHRYRFVRDGVAQRPPDAERYRRDDFGGEDGVIDVSP